MAAVKQRSSTATHDEAANAPSVDLGQAGSVLREPTAHESIGAVKVGQRVQRDAEPEPATCGASMCVGAKRLATHAPARRQCTCSCTRPAAAAAYQNGSSSAVACRCTSVCLHHATRARAHPVRTGACLSARTEGMVLGSTPECRCSAPCVMMPMRLHRASTSSRLWLVMIMLRPDARSASMMSQMDRRVSGSDSHGAAGRSHGSMASDDIRHSTQAGTGEGGGALTEASRGLVQQHDTRVPEQSNAERQPAVTRACAPNPLR